MVDKLRNKYDDIGKLKKTFIIVNCYEKLKEEQLNTEYRCCTFL
jgi:hypothetical protein